MPILSVDGLLKSYHRRRVVDGVAMDVYPGEIVGLLGPNGAGKTTTFHMICGMVRPDAGTVMLSGEDVTQWPMYLRARRGGMGYLPQQSSVFARLSAEDNLYGMMQLLGFKRRRQRERCDELLDQFKIDHVRKTKAGKLSGGERRRLEIARCLVSDPQIIMLDEPFAGIDPVTVQNIQVVIRELSENDIAILITDHAAREILQITDRTYVMDEGQILLSGTADEIVRHEQVRSKYLGDIDFSRKPELESNAPSNLDGTTKSTQVLEQPHLESTIRFSRRAKRSTATPDVDPENDENVQATPTKRKPITSPFRSTDLD